ncbi:MAG: sugar isomerase domain-containing protein [Spirochaetaceae bacterium]|nr:MAG: sugar isomerase domain-containing protein [Spirochaetaceae bacterium]
MDLGKEFSARINEIITTIEQKQKGNIDRAAAEMKRSIAEDRLIYVFGGGGHTCLVMQELFWRAGGLANLCPLIDFAIHPVTPAYLYLGHERMHGIGNHLVDYYGVGKDDVILVFHSYGFNPPTIDCALEAKSRGATVVGISSSLWQEAIPRDFFIRHSSKKNLFEIADICIDNYVPFGDAVINVDGFDKPVSGVSSIIDIYIAHRLEMECVASCVSAGITPPVWSSANLEGGDVSNAELRKRYNSRVKFL